ncbi:hypothetical protein Tco_1578289 [Tanacetum coccineum]
MPPALTSKGLWNVCASHGRLVDAFIANKLSKDVSLWFIKFLGVKDANSIVNSMSNIWIGDEKFQIFYGLINQKRQNQMINGIMVEENWITNPYLIKDAFFQFYKRKFQAQDSQVMFSNLPHSHSLNCMDRETLERQVTLEEIKEEVLGLVESS